MSTRSIKLNASQVEQLQKMDEAIQSRSLEIGRISIALRQMETNLISLYDFRNNLIKQALKAADIPQENIRVEVDPDSGQISVQINDELDETLNPDSG